MKLNSDLHKDNLNGVKYFRINISWELLTLGVCIKIILVNNLSEKIPSAVTAYKILQH